MKPESRDWSLAYEGYRPEQEGLREALCTLGNGYFARRGAAPHPRQRARARLVCRDLGQCPASPARAHGASSDRYGLFQRFITIHARPATLVADDDVHYQHENCHPEGKIKVGAGEHEQAWRSAMLAAAKRLLDRGPARPWRADHPPIRLGQTLAPGDRDRAGGAADGAQKPALRRAARFR